MKKIYLIAVISAIITAFAVYQFGNSVENNAKNKVEGSVSVVVANTNIAENTIITQEMVALKQISRELVSSSATNNTEDVVGKIAKYSISSGEPIYSSRLFSVGGSDGAQLSYELEKGYRAVSMSVDNVSGVSGHIRKGDRVDVVAYFTKEGNTGNRAVLEDVLVLRAGSDTNASEYSTVTLALKPQDAIDINYIVANAIVRLILRSPLG